MRRRTDLIFLVIIAVVVCVPLYFIFTGSFMSQDEVMDNVYPLFNNSERFVKWNLLPLYPTLQQYVELLIDSPEFFVMFWNSMKITLLTIGGQLLVGTLAAWGFARYKFPGGKILFWIYMILMMMPFQVRMISDYLTLDMWQLLDTHWAIILPGIFSSFPIFIMYQFFERLPQALVESARLDGASELYIFWKIGVPLGMPGIISMMVLGFLECWNLIEQPLVFLKSKSLWPLSLYLPETTMERTAVLFTASVIALIPALLVFLCGQDYLERGIIASAVKE